MRRVLFLVAMVCLAVSPLLAQDPVKVDPKHYKLEFENEHVRVLRITYGPHEKSAMHYHPAAVAVFLTDQNVRFTFPDGNTEDIVAKADSARWLEAGRHLPENLRDERFELILVEMKTKRRGY